MIPKGAIEAYAGQCPLAGAVVFLPAFKENGRHCLAAFYGYPDGECSWAMVASARRKGTMEKAKAVALAWYGGLFTGKECGQ